MIDAQCSIPVFEGLFPDPHNTQVLRLLFLLCHWHGLAKLRLHTDETLIIFEKVTRDLGDCIRSFTSDTCPHFTTKELAREAEARQRRQAQQNLSTSNQSQSAVLGHGRLPKGLNLQTYKLHALADYPSQIKMYGTTDSYSTQSVCLARSWHGYCETTFLLRRVNLSTVQAKFGSLGLVARHTYPN